MAPDSTAPKRGALPYRSVKPRPGELPDIDGAVTEGALFTPVLYCDTETLGREQAPLLRCPTCGFSFVSIWGVRTVKRDDYMLVATEPVECWGLPSEAGESVPPIEEVRHNSLVFEIRCDLGHVGVVEFAHHKGQTHVGVSRVDVETAQ